MTYGMPVWHIIMLLLLVPQISVLGWVLLCWWTSGSASTDGASAWQLAV